MPAPLRRCPYRDRAPLLTIRAGRPALLVTLTVPEAIAYAVEVERRFRGLALADARKEMAS